jgi:hypothetical protein
MAGDTRSASIACLRRGDPRQQEQLVDMQDMHEDGYPRRATYVCGEHAERKGILACACIASQCWKNIIRHMSNESFVIAHKGRSVGERQRNRLVALTKIRQAITRHVARLTNEQHYSRVQTLCNSGADQETMALRIAMPKTTRRRLRS